MSHDSRTAEERRILERWRSDPEEQAALRKAVRTVLEHVFERQEEVPLIAMYRCGGVAGAGLCMFRGFVWLWVHQRGVHGAGACV